MVHMPDHGAHVQDAKYVIDTGNGTKVTRYAMQRTYPEQRGCRSASSRPMASRGSPWLRDRAWDR